MRTRDAVCDVWTTWARASALPNVSTTLFLDRLTRVETGDTFERVVSRSDQVSYVFYFILDHIS